MTNGRANVGPSETSSVSETSSASDTIDMSVDLAGMRLPNPLMTASGCAANGKELHRFFDIAQLGAFVTKTVLADPRSGRGTPRMAETPSGMLNSIGLQGPGVDDFARNDLVWLKSVGARVLASIAGNTAGEYADVAAVLRASPAFDAVVGIEVNISCPNVANRGLVFACDPLSAAKVIALVREKLPRDIPIFAKLSPDVTDIVEIARACVKAGADGLTQPVGSGFDAGTGDLDDVGHVGAELGEDGDVSRELLAYQGDDLGG